MLNDDPYLANKYILRDIVFFIRRKGVGDDTLRSLLKQRLCAEYCMQKVIFFYISVKITMSSTATSLHV